MYSEMGAIRPLNGKFTLVYRDGQGAGKPWDVDARDVWWLRTDAGARHVFHRGSVGCGIYGGECSLSKRLSSDRRSAYFLSSPFIWRHWLGSSPPPHSGDRLGARIKNQGASDGVALMSVREIRHHYSRWVWGLPGPTSWPSKIDVVIAQLLPSLTG